VVLRRPDGQLAKKRNRARALKSLGFAETAFPGAVEIAAAFKAKARACHPDTSTSDDVPDMAVLTAAKETLIRSLNDE